MQQSGIHPWALFMSKQFVGIPSLMWGGFADGRLKGNALLVFTAIASFAPRSFPSVRRISEFAHLNRKTVFKYLNILEQLKIIKRHRRNGTSNVYEINPSLLPSKMAEQMRCAVKKMTEEWFKKKTGRVSVKAVPISGNQSTTTHISTVTRVTLGMLNPAIQV